MWDSISPHSQDSSLKLQTLLTAFLPVNLIDVKKLSPIKLDP